MSRFILLAILFALIHVSSTGQITVKIEVKNLNSNAGSVILDFRDCNDQHLDAFSAGIFNNECKIIIDSLTAGKYSFKYFHDKNNNKNLDTSWIGIPIEGYGFSNNAKAKFGPPKFNDTVFEIKNDTTIVCKAYYHKL